MKIFVFNIIPLFFVLTFYNSDLITNNYQDPVIENSITFKSVEKILSNKIIFESQNFEMTGGCNFGYCSCIFLNCYSETGDTDGCWMIFELCMCGAYGECHIQ